MREIKANFETNESNFETCFVLHIHRISTKTLGLWNLISVVPKFCSILFHHTSMKSWRGYIFITICLWKSANKVEEQYISKYVKVKGHMEVSTFSEWFLFNLNFAWKIAPRNNQSGKSCSPPPSPFNTISTERDSKEQFLLYITWTLHIELHVHIMFIWQKKTDPCFSFL